MSDNAPRTPRTLTIQEAVTLSGYLATKYEDSPVHDAVAGTLCDTLLVVEGTLEVDDFKPLPRVAG